MALVFGWLLVSCIAVLVLWACFIVALSYWKPYRATICAWQGIPRFIPRMPWLVSWGSTELEDVLDLVLSVLKHEGLGLAVVPDVRRLPPETFWRVGSRLAMSWKHPQDKRGLIIAQYSSVFAERVFQVFLIAHEVGHILDFTYERKEHWLLEYLKDAGDERFANMIAWFCLEWIKAFEEGTLPLVPELTIPILEFKLNQYPGDQDAQRS